MRFGRDLLVLLSLKGTSFLQELRKLKAANNGNSAAYEHVLFLAYGRKGKLRWELMEVSTSARSRYLANEF